MTTMKKTLALVMLLCITLGAQAQLLWKISGTDSTDPRTSWVPTIWLPSASRTALQA